MIAKVKLELWLSIAISKSTTLQEMSVKFYAVLSLSFCMVLVLYLFPGLLPGQNKSSNVFSEAIRKTPKLLFSIVLNIHAFTEQTMLATGVLLFSETLARSCFESTATRKRKQILDKLFTQSKVIDLGLQVIE